MLLLADFSLKRRRGSASRQQIWGGHSTVLWQGEERVFIIVSGCIDLPECHGVGVSRSLSLSLM